LRRAAALLLLAGAVLSAPARAQGTPPKSPAALPVRTAQVELEKGVVKLTLGFRDVVDADITKKLNDGLTTVINMRGYLFQEGGSAPIALAAKSCRVAREIWDDVFHIQLVQPGGATHTVAVNLEGVLRNCCEAKKLPLADPALLLAGTRYFVATLIEVNPVTQEMLDRIKRWVTRPNGASAIGPGDSLFGSFVGLFVARIRDADKKLAFRTQLFFPPMPPPPSP
jgi:hypothetical protein